MGYPVKSAWKPWTATDGSLGGFITQYAPAGGKTFDFVTIRGAGHMVP